MTEIRKNQKVLHAKVNGEWRYVFCNNIPNGLITMDITTEKRKKAIHGDDALKYFQKRYSSIEFCYSVDLPTKDFISSDLENKKEMP
jgi:hypothetical protein